MRKGSSQRPQLCLTLDVVPQPGMSGTTVAPNPRHFLTGQPVPGLAADARSNRAERLGWGSETDRDMAVSVFYASIYCVSSLRKSHECMVNLCSIEN